MVKLFGKRNSGLRGVVVKLFQKDPFINPLKLEDIAEEPNIAYFANFKISKNSELKDLLLVCLDFWDNLNID